MLIKIIIIIMLSLLSILQASDINIDIPHMTETNNGSPMEGGVGQRQLIGVRDAGGWEHSIGECGNELPQNTSRDTETWTPDSMDLKRAIPNDPTPPERLVPLATLQPLSPDAGIIRRVKLSGDLKAIALTFDMCELETVTTGCDMDVLNLLREREIPATLFMGGKWMRTHSRRVMQIMREPLFEIANHNWSHGNAALLSSQDLTDQILWTQSEYELLREEAGLSGEIPDVPKLFRLPYGRSSERALKTIAGLGLRVIQWDVAAESGGDNMNVKRAKRSAKLVAGMTRPGSILLFHANAVPKGTAVLLREVIDLLESQGYTFVTVSELLSMGEPEMVRDGYFSKPGDNRALDSKFGIGGTGRRRKAVGK